MQYSHLSPAAQGNRLTGAVVWCAGSPCQLLGIEYTVHYVGKSARKAARGKISLNCTSEERRHLETLSSSFGE